MADVLAAVMPLALVAAMVWWGGQPGPNPDWMQKIADKMALPCD